MSHYLGRNPAVGTQRTLDSIESQFNGVLTTFNLRYSGQPTYPTLSASLIVSLGGVLQEPGEAYYVSSDTIVFSEAPQAGTECWILLYSEYGAGIGAAEQGNIGAANVTLTGELRGPSNFVIDPAAVGNNTGTVEIKGNLTVQGTTTTINSTTVDLDHIALGDNELANFGDGNDLRIYHDGSNSYIDNTTANTLFIRNASTGNIDVRTSTTSRAFVAYNAGQVELFYADSKKLETTNTGVSVTGDTISSRVGIGTSTIAAGNILQTAGGSVLVGASTDTNAYLTLDGVSNSYFNLDSTNGHISTGSNLILYTGGSERLRVDSSGNVGIGTTAINSGKLSVYTTSLPGAGDYNGQNFAIVVGTDGGDVANSEGNGIVFTQQYASDAVDSGPVRTGAIVGWKNQGTGSFGGGLKIKVQPAGANPLIDAICIRQEGNVGIGITNPNEKLMVGSGSVRIDGGYLKMTGVATPNHENYIQMTGNGTSYIGVGAEANPTIKFKVGSTSTTILDISSTEVTPGADATYNLGSPTKRWANIYSGDLQLSNEGSATGNEVDGTWGAYTIQEGEHDLFLINRRSGKKFKFILEEVK